MRKRSGLGGIPRPAPPPGTIVLGIATSGMAALAVILLLLPSATFASVYGQGLYPALSAFFSFVTAWTPVPVGMAIVPLACGIFLWRSLVGSRHLPLLDLLLRPLLLATLLVSCYLVVWGVNYRRPPLIQLVGVVPQDVSQDELDALAGDLLAWVRVSAAELDDDSWGAAGAGTKLADASGALAAVARELERLSLELGWPATLPSRLKTLPPGTLLSSGYSGMLFPFTLEPQVDAGLSAVSRVSVGAHELAHAAGFASEADADLAALLAGLRTPQPLARYATALTLLGRSLASLSEEQRLFVVDNLPPRALRDLSEARARSGRYLRSSLAARVTAVYDRLLEGQGVEAGVAAYQMAPELAALLSIEGVLPDPPLGFPDGGTDEGTSPTLADPTSDVPQLLAARGR